MKKFSASLFFVPWFFAALGFAGDISGRIYFRPDAPGKQIAGRYGVSSSTVTMAHVEHDIRAVVYLADEFPDSTFALPQQNPVMDQRNQQFVPYILPVLAGTTVDFPNNDNVYHNVFSFSKTKTFDLGKYPTKTSRQVTFDKTGVVSLYCEIHAHMNAFILVLPNPFYTTVLQDGEIVIRDIPAGSYTVMAFFGHGAELAKKIIVPEQGTVHVEFFQ